MPVRTGVDADAAAIRAFAPDLVVVATGAVPRPAPFDVSRVTVPVRQAWDVLATPAPLGTGTRVSIVGAGAAGLECADLLAAHGCTVVVFEATASAGRGLARNNRMDLLDRLAAAGVEVVLDARITAADGTDLCVAVEIGRAHV